MKEEPSDTKAVKRVTNKLEQLPSSKKRTLNTDLLATPLTHRLDDASPKDEKSALTPETQSLKAKSDPSNIASTQATTMSLSSSLTSETAKVSETTNLNPSLTTGHPSKAITVNKEVQATTSKESAKENSKEVVQEILKEVAKEVEKDNAVKAAGNTSKQSFVETKKVKEPTKEAKELLQTKPPAIATMPLATSVPPTKQEPVVDNVSQKASWAEQPLEPVKAVTGSKKIVNEKPQENVVEKEVKSNNILNVEAQASAQVEAKSDDLEENKPNSQVEMPLFNSINKFSYSGTEVKTTKGKIKSLVLWSMPIAILLAVFIGIIYIVPALREKVASKLPPNVASTLRLTSKQVSLVSIQEYRYSIDEKEKTAKISGIVKNLSDNPIGPLELEFQLTKREGMNVVETKKVLLDPPQLAAKEEGKYEFTILAKDYLETKFVSMTSGNKTELKVKKLGIIDPPSLDPSQVPTVEPLPNNKPKQQDNNIYDGSVN